MLTLSKVPQAINTMTVELRLKKAQIALMRHPETALYAGCMMMGETSIVDTGITAYTDGLNKRYGRKFIETKCTDDAELRALVLHENLHVALRHCIHGKAMFKEDPRRAGMAADYVVNGIIVNLKDATLCKLPEGGLVNSKYFDWSIREVFDDLKKEDEGKCKDKGPEGTPCPAGEPGGDAGEGEDGEAEGEDSEGQNPDEPNDDGPEDGEGNPTDKPGEDEGEDGTSGGGFDNHDFNGEHEIDGKPVDSRQLGEAIDRALREGMLLAGRLGADIPRAISEELEAKVDWREAMRDFISSTCSGKDEYTWRKFNRRTLANDEYYPTTEDETVSELIVAIDTSGSIGATQLNEFAAELLAICNTVQPDKVRVLWWGTSVVGEQVFEDQDYEGLIAMLKPRGGGGTCAGSVAEHIQKNNLLADAVIVFTDGFVEDPITWDIAHPTLWMVTMNKAMNVPAGGKMVMVD